ncbi:MAG: ankyrin repeat domain-containing protein [Planctomycetia bacterium]|nr:ankyrin repeat domain-containing protein [Planctomycetia bacterium]
MSDGENEEGENGGSDGNGVRKKDDRENGAAAVVRAMERNDPLGRFCCTGSHCHSPAKLADVRWNPAAERRAARLENDPVSPLCLAIEERRPSEAIRLIHDGADVHETAKDGWTPVHLAAAVGLTRVLETLVGAGADPVVRTESGLTPLHLAALTGDDSLVRYLCDLRPEMVNVAEKDRLMTALHLAVENRHRAVTETLITDGAEPSLRNADGRTPLEIAVDRGYTELVTVLRDYG